MLATVTGRMGNMHAGRHDRVIGAGFVMGMCGGALLIVGELVGLPEALWALGIVLFLLGLVGAAVAAGLASRSTGNGWLRSFAGGVRAAFRFLVEFLP